MNDDLEKRMRSALRRAAISLASACDLLIDEGVDDEDLTDEIDLAKECAELSKEGIK